MPEGPENSLIKRTEDLFFLLQHSLTTDAKNTIWHLLELAKETYATSNHPEDWDAILEDIQKLMMDFANESSDASEMKLLAMHQNMMQMKKKQEKSREEQ